MKRKHLIITAAVLLVIIAGGITAYSLLNRSTQEPDEENFLPAGWETDIDKLKDTTLTFYINGPRTSDDDKVLEAVNRKLRDDLKTNISFKYYWEYYDDFLNRVRRDNASGITCDAFLYNTNIQTPVKALADEGLIMDVSKLFPEYAPGYYSQFSGEDIKAMNVNGGIYVIPSRMPSASMRYVLVRQDLMEKYGIPEIHSYDDYEVFLDAIVKNEPDMIPVRFKDTSLGFFADMYGYVVLDYITGLVYKWDDPDMRLTTWDQTPEFMEGLERLQRWYDNGYLDVENNKLTDGFSVVNGKFEFDIYDHLITDLKSASFICNPDEQMRINALLRSKGITDCYFRAYPLCEGYSARNSLMESGIMINSVSQQAERVLMFIDWLQSDSINYDLLMYGQKDINYIDREDYIEPPADAAVTFQDWSWRTAFENIDYRRGTYPGNENEIRAYSAIISERTRYAPHYGFTPDYSAVKDIYNNMLMRYSILERVIYMGYDTEDYMEWFRDEQKKAGADIMISEIQNQLDKYMKGITG